jgi:hypothetical protein
LKKTTRGSRKVRSRTASTASGKSKKPRKKKPSAERWQETRIRLDFKVRHRLRGDKQPGVGPEFEGVSYCAAVVDRLVGLGVIDKDYLIQPGAWRCISGFRVTGPRPEGKRGAWISRTFST